MDWDNPYHKDLVVHPVEDKDHQLECQETRRQPPRPNTAHQSEGTEVTRPHLHTILIVTSHPLAPPIMVPHPLLLELEDQTIMEEQERCHHTHTWEDREDTQDHLQ